MLSLMAARPTKSASPPPLLRGWREYKKAKPADLADLLGIERESYYRLEREPHTISVRQLLKLADAFGIHPRQFWTLPPRDGKNPRRSLDEIVEEMPDSQVNGLADMIERTIGKS